MLQVESREEESEEIFMEEDEGDPFGIHPPASERGTLAGISTHPNSHQATRSLNNQGGPRDQEELPTRRPLLLEIFARGNNKMVIIIFPCS